MKNDQNCQELKALLRKVIAPIKDTELQRDLWPQMLAKLEEQPFRLPWFDWALAAAVSAALLFFPGAIPALLYHL
jgi:hypothetical protein